MSAVADLRGILAGDSAIAALVGARIYPALLPQPPTFPALTYQVVSGFRHTQMDGPPGVNRARLQIDCWAATYIGAEALADAVRLALDGFKGMVGGSPGRLVQAAFFASERDLYEPEPPCYRRSADYLITYAEDA